MAIKSRNGVELTTTVIHTPLLAMYGRSIVIAFCLCHFFSSDTACHIFTVMHFLFITSYVYIEVLVGMYFMIEYKLYLLSYVPTNVNL